MTSTPAPYLISPPTPPESAGQDWVSFRDRFMGSASGEQILTIREGVSSAYLVSFARSVQTPQESVFQLVGLPSSTAKRKIARKETLDPLVSERLLRLGALEKQAEDTFGDADLAHRWLRTENLSLGGLAPLALADTEIGCREVTRVLTAIAYGGSV